MDEYDERHVVFLESKQLCRLALPRVAMYMVNYMMSIATQIFFGHLGNLELIVFSLGNMGIQVFDYGLMVYTNRPNLLIEILIYLLTENGNGAFGSIYFLIFSCEL